MKPTLAVLVGAGCLLFAADGPPQKVQVVHTERADLPSGGLLQFKNSVGELTVEGWDQPDVEITTIKSTKDVFPSGQREKMAAELDKLKITVEHQSDGLTVTTSSRRRHAAPAVDYDVEYRIKSPRNARLAVEHGNGEVHVDNLTADVHVTVRKGEITLHLPQEGQYGIDAKSDLGSVVSDFPGQEKRLRWRVGHTFVQAAQAAPHLYLRVGFGDIILLRIPKVAMPTSLTQ
jgi:hypothetical protein